MTAFDPEFTVHFHRILLSTLRRIMQFSNKHMEISLNHYSIFMRLPWGYAGLRWNIC